MVLNTGRPILTNMTVMLPERGVLESWDLDLVTLYWSLALFGRT